jgi:hypothetical protein
MTAIASRADLTIPGICTNLPLTGWPTDHEVIVTTSSGRIHPQTDLVLGETLAHGVIHIECDDPRYWDAIAEHALRNAAFLRALNGTVTP